MKTFFVVLAVFAMACAVVKGQIPQQSGSCGSFSNNCNYTMIISDNEKSIKIFGTGYTGDYSSAAATPWASYQSLIRTIVIEDGITAIGTNIFKGFTILKEVTLGATLKTIGAEAFRGCPILKTATLPTSVEEVGDYAFAECPKLETANVESVKKLGTGAYQDCDAITSVTISNTMTSLGDNAFAYCEKLTSINVEEGHEIFSSVDGVLFKNKTLVQYPAGKSGHYTIPDGTTEIGVLAFAGSANLDELTIPETVTTFGNSAFADCDGLTYLTIPASVTTVGTAIFEKCDNLTQVFYQGTKDVLSNSNVLPASVITVCVPKGYKATKFLGKTVTSSNETCVEYQTLFNDCHVGAYVNGNLSQQMSKTGADWVSRTNGCMLYTCNVTPASERICVGVSNLCLKDACMESWETKLTGWKVVIAFEGLKIEKLNETALVENIKAVCNETSGTYDIGFEVDDENNVTHVVVSADGEETAKAIEAALKAIDKESCVFGTLCQFTTVEASYTEPELSSVSAAVSIHDVMVKGVMLLVLAVLLL